MSARIAARPAALAREAPYERVTRILATFWLYCLVLASLVILLLPIAWMLSTSFKPLEDVFSYPPRWIPEHFTLANYRAQLNVLLGTYFLNSVIVGACSAVLSTVAGALAAYGLARYRFRGNAAVLMFFMASLAFPIPLLMISMYILFVNLQLLNTYAALVIGHTVITLPVAVWLLKSFFDQLPVEIEEAAYVDGASPMYTFWRIVLPMARPALAASAIFVFVTSWNELLFGLTFTSSNDMRPLPAGISMSFLTEFEGQWGEMTALATMVSIPIFLLFVFFQKTFMRGVTAGAVKG
jgi:multiple sugar transport system permease protein